MTQKEEFPIEFKKFLKMCEGTGISIDNLNIDVEQIKHSYEKYTYITLKPKDDLEKNIEITFDYISEVDYLELMQDIKKLEEATSISKSSLLTFLEEDNIEELKKYGYYYSEASKEDIIEEYCEKHECQPTMITRKRAIEDFITDVYKNNCEELDCLREIQNRVNKGCPCGLKGTVSIENIDFVYSPESIKGGIILNNGIVIFEMPLTETGIPANIQFNSYDNLVDWEWQLQLNNFVIDYNDISDTMKKLKEKNIEPKATEVVNYEEMLHKNDLDNLGESPIGVVYQLKDVITQTYLKDSNSKKQ